MMAALHRGSENCKHKHAMATCPSCHAYGQFTFAGVQHIPEAAAQKLGFDQFVLWHCDHCNSTLSELDLADILPG